MGVVRHLRVPTALKYWLVKIGRKAGWGRSDRIGRCTVAMGRVRQWFWQTHKEQFIDIGWAFSITRLWVPLPNRPSLKGWELPADAL